MQLIVAKPTPFPIEAESVDAAKQAFCDALKIAALAGYSTFSVWGTRFVVNDYAEVNTVKWLKDTLERMKRYHVKVELVTEGEFFLDGDPDNDNTVRVLPRTPQIWTMDDWIKKSRSELAARALRWIKVDESSVHFLDDRCNHQIALPAGVEGGAARLTPKTGPAVIFRPDMEYEIYRESEEGLFVIRSGIYTVRVSKEDSGWEVVSTYR